MARPRQIDPLVVKRAQQTAVASTSVESLRQCQAVLLPALFGATLEQTALVLGVGRATVARLQTTFRKQKPAGPNPARNWGGRRQSLLILMRFQDETKCGTVAHGKTTPD